MHHLSISPAPRPGQYWLWPRLWHLTLALSALLLAPTANAFCGFFAGRADASLFNEASQVILVRDGQRTVISMLNDFKGPLTDFALVVPVPQVLEKGQVRIGDKRLFDRLDAYSAPRVAEYFDPDPCPMNRWELGRGGLAQPMVAMAEKAAAPAADRARALGVTVEASYTVGEYDIVMLSAKQSDGLQTWLLENGYRMPRGAAAALRPYVAQNMKFFVAKVNLKEQAATGVNYLRPLQFAFESEKFMLPIRLGMINADPAKAQDLIVYALTRKGRVESSNYRTVKLPANENLPPAIKKNFNAFYKAMFDHQAQVEQHRVVFTEYFWDMAWCDPCAADPMSPQELRQAGVFWIDDGATPARSQRAPLGAGQDALLTRLHVRYTSSTFPEDLMFVQTQDRQNWQTRYVVQQSFGGSVQQCRDKAAQQQCRDADCRSSVNNSLEQARQYYLVDLPERQQRELQTLMRFTGWSSEEARRFAGSSAEAPPVNPVPWWKKLFGSADAAVVSPNTARGRP